MSSFYGNMKNNSRSSFIIDKVYPSRKAMEEALTTHDLNETLLGDGVFVNRYVLIDYGYSLDVDDNAIYNLSVNGATDQIKAKNRLIYDSLYRALSTLERNNIPQEWYKSYYFVDTENGRSNYYLKLQSNITNNVDELARETQKFFDIYSNASIPLYERKVYVDRFIPILPSANNYLITTDPGNLLNVGIPTESEIYHTHKMADYTTYNAVYDRTVWMKIYIDNRERYIMVALLDSLLPGFLMVDDAPSCLNGSPHIDLRLSTDYNYLYHMPKNWNVILNQYDPSNTASYTTSTNNYYYYERSTTSTPKTYDETVKYPYINEAGFNKIKLSKVISTSNPASITALYVTATTYANAINVYNTKSASTYPTHTFRHILLTSNTYYPNRYYIAAGPSLDRTNYKITPNNPAAFDIDKAYYTGSPANNPTTFTYVPLRLDPTDNLYKPVNYSTATTYYYDNVDSTSWFTKSTTTTFSSTAVYYEVTWKLSYRYNCKQLTSSSYVENLYYTVDLTKDRSNYVVAEGATFNINYAYYIKSGNNYIYKPLKLNTSDNKYYPTDYTASTTYYYDPVTTKSWFKKATGRFSSSLPYFEEVITKATSRLNDTKRTDVYLPIIGTSISDIFDVIYGAPRYVEQGSSYSNLIGYASPEQYELFKTQTSGSNYWSDPSVKFTLTTAQYNSLSPELYPGLYDIPIYIAASNKRRPYNDIRLMSELSPPYNNIGADEASVGWALTVLKRYISELRFLAKGTMVTENGEIVTGFGLLSDWNLDDRDAFGFINHRPAIITTFIPVTDPNSKDPTLTYYIKEIEYQLDYGEIEVYHKKLGSSSWSTFASDVNEGKVYRLPAMTSANENRLIITYVLTTGNFNADTTYYFKETNGVYKKAYVINTTTSYTSITDTTELNKQGLCRYMLGYRITTAKVNGNNIITKREYKVFAGVGTDKIYLAYGNVCPKDFWLIVNNAGDTTANAPALEVNNLISTMSRSNTLNFLSNFTGNSTIYTVDTDSTDCSKYLNNITSNTQGFSYVKLVLIDEYTDINSSNYSTYKDRLYIRTITEDNDPLLYEIHNIWGKAVGTSIIKDS